MLIFRKALPDGPSVRPCANPPKNSQHIGTVINKTGHAAHSAQWFSRMTCYYSLASNTSPARPVCH